MVLNAAAYHAGYNLGFNCAGAACLGGGGRGRLWGVPRCTGGAAFCDLC
jgi:hypothetical protein